MTRPSHTCTRAELAVVVKRAEKGPRVVTKRATAAGLVLAALASVVVIAHPSTAHAQQPADSAGNRDVAREFFLAGVAAYQRNSYNAALASFENAYRIAPHPSVRINIANCHVQLRHYNEALVHFEAYLAEAQNVAPAQRAEVERQIQEVRAQLAEVRVRITPAVNNTTLTVDGQVTSANTPVRLAPGRHVFAVSADGYTAEQATLELRANSTREWNVELRPVGAEPQNPVVITPPPEQNPGGAGNNPPPVVIGPQLPPGGETPPPPARETSIWSLPRAMPMYIAAGVTGLGLVGWVGLGAGALASNGAFNNAARNISMGIGNYSTERSRGTEAASRARSLAIGADVCMGVTIAGAAATGVLFFLNATRGPRRSSPERMTFVVTPLTGDGATGLAVGGAF